MRLSFAERQRRISKGLCFSCGGGGHVITTCPTRPPRLWVSAIRHPPQNMQPLTIYLRLYEVDSQQLHAKTYLILTCSETYLLFLLLVGSCVFLVCLPSSVSEPPLIWGVCFSSSSTSSWQDKYLQYILYSLVKLLKVILTISPCSRNC